MRQMILALALTCVTLSPARAADKAGTRPELYFGTVNYLSQLAEHPDQWRKTAEVIDGMLIHVHYFVRGLDTRKNKFARADVIDVARRIAPLLEGKRNVVELTFHIRDAKTDPAGIAREHAANIADIEREMGIAIADVNVDWILEIFNVAAQEAPRKPSETDAAWGRRLVANAAAKSRTYVQAFRAAGRDERLIAVFPPIYLNQGRWPRQGKNVEPGTVQITDVLGALFDAGFDGFTADTPHGLIANRTYEKWGYHDALRAAQSTCQRRGKLFGMIVNSEVDREPPASLGEADWDAKFQRESLDVIARLPKMRLAPQRIIVESWYKGPYRLVPETEPGTLTHTVLEAADAISPR